MDHLPPQTSDLGTYPQLVTSGGDHWSPVQICSFGDLPPSREQHLGVATETRNMYGFYAGGVHPTETLSCTLIISKDKVLSTQLRVQ